MAGKSRGSREVHAQFCERLSVKFPGLLDRNPDWEVLPSQVPPRLQQVIRTCLQKNVKQHIGHIQDLRLAMEGALIAAPLDTAGDSAGFTAGAPATVIPGGYYTAEGSNNLGHTYDVSPGGQRFLMIKEGGDTDQAGAPANLIVVQNWLEELKRLVP